MDRRYRDRPERFVDVTIQKHFYSDEINASRVQSEAPINGKETISIEKIRHLIQLHYALFPVYFEIFILQYTCNPVRLSTGHRKYYHNCVPYY